MDAIAAAALTRLRDFAFQNIANIAWSYAILEIADSPLLNAISAEAINRVNAFAHFQVSRKELLNSAMFVLSVAWSFAFLHLLTEFAFATFKQSIGTISKEADRRGGDMTDKVSDLSLRLDGNTDWIQTRQGIKPRLLIDLPGMIVIYKPTDWEVDGLVVEGGEHPPLSAYVQSVFPRELFPLVHNAEQNFGFLHRLDIPSSGLVLGGTTFEGYYTLRLQLDTQRLQREYMVIGRNLPPSSFTEVVARVDVAPDPSQRKSINDSGKPSQTFISLGAHLEGRSDLEEGRACLVVIQIFTGRRHQIRVHLRFSGIPSVSDARYTAREVSLFDPALLDASSSTAVLQGVATASVDKPLMAMPPARRPLRMRTYH